MALSRDVVEKNSSLVVGVRRVGWGVTGGNGEICNKETSWKRLHDSPPPRRRQLLCSYIRGGGG
jgi:hypothetical protein